MAQGTSWYSTFKWEPIAQFNTLVNFDAMTLSNHEFDNGVDVILPFMKNTSCPIVVANLKDVNMNSEFKNLYSK